MIDIQRLAREAGYKHPDAVGECENFAYFDIEKFASLYREVVVSELVAGSGEPVMTKQINAFTQEVMPVEYYSRDQLAGAVLRERERAAKVCESLPSFGSGDATAMKCDCAAAIRSGNETH